MPRFPRRPLPENRSTRLFGNRSGAAIAIVVLAVQLHAQTSPPRLSDLSLEELMKETVTSVSKREQKLTDAATAITVLSNDDLHRSGATTIADALRLVPGMDVGSVNSSQWAISARGFNQLYANKLLVLVDGRAVYSPLFAGVYWDVQQTSLEDVDRIEVIRGPGATVWGANAVNGVVNVVTRSARDTQGGLLYGTAGDVQQTNSGVRYGGQLDPKTYYRVFASYLSKDDYRQPNGSRATDSWQGKHGGFRLDRYPDADTQLTWQADATQVNTDDDLTDARNINTLGRFTRRWSDRSSVEVQAYYDHVLRDETARGRVRSDTSDLSAQHTFGVGERNDVIWGLGYRYIASTIDQTTPLLEVRDGDVNTQLFSAFIQDEFKIVPDKVAVTAGVKLEHNDYTGVEIQPGLRGVYKPTPRQTLWAAASRAVRTPAGIESKDVFAITTGAPFIGPGGLLYTPKVVGNPGLASEVLWAYELGYRIQTSKRVSFDAALFYNDYSHLSSLGTVSQFIPGAPVGTAEIPFDNALEGVTYGGEVSMTVTPSDSWRLTASYSVLIANINGPATANPQTIERGSPRNQIALRSSYDFTHRLSMDAQIRYVDTIMTVPAYITADLRFAYKITDRLELSIIGQNLLDDQHPEQGAAFFVTTTEVPRGFYSKLSWRF